MSQADQNELFPGGTPLPVGFLYREDLLPPQEETRLLDNIATLPLSESRYRQWTAKRRTLSFGGSYDFTHLQLNPAEPIPEFLHAVRATLAEWAGIAPDAFTHASITEYAPGTQLGWHRDVPDFDVVLGASLRGTARMRFRPYPPRPGWTREALAIDLKPRSAYIIRDAARWQWQHAISPTKELRYSITFRTLR